MLKISSFTKTIPTRSSLPFFKYCLQYSCLSFFRFIKEGQLNVNSYNFSLKKFNLIRHKRRIGFTLINLINIYFTLKACIRTISTLSEPKPTITYINPYEEKILIIKQNKGKCGIYRWVHKYSGKSYIGSSSKLNDRFRRYFNHSYLSNKKRGVFLICKALLKYGYAGFRLDILEYCSSTEVLSREQFYLDSCKPEYNILKIARSNLGYKHSEASLKLMSKASKSRNQLEEVLIHKRKVMLGRKLSKNQLDNMAKNNPFRQPILLSNN